MIIKICTVEGCQRKATKRSMCEKHYLREWKVGVFTNERTKGEHGLGYMHPDGYWYITVDGRQIGEHIYVAEKALDKKLPKGAQVHHWDRDKCNNIPSNLVICPNREYHELLHRRARELGYESYHGGLK